MDLKLFLIPLITLFINQLIKMLIEILRGNFSWYKIFSYGGMPSSHSSLVTSLAIVIGYYQGLDSADFALALILALIVIKDASGIRLKLGQQGKIINSLIKELPDWQEYKYPVLAEKLGHTNFEVLMGILASIIITSILISLF